MTSPRSFTLVGAGGHALSVADALLSVGYTVQRYFADSRSCPHIPEDLYGGDITRFERGPGSVALAIGDNTKRQASWNAIQGRVDVGQLSPVIHRTAFVSPSAHLEPGCVVLAGAFIGPQSFIGFGALVNTAAIVEHETRIGDFASLAPGAICGGGARIGDRAFLGLSATVAPNCHIGSGTVVGANSFVKESIPEDSFAFGTPARVLNR